LKKNYIKAKVGNKINVDIYTCEQKQQHNILTNKSAEFKN